MCSRCITLAGNEQVFDKTVTGMGSPGSNGEKGGAGQMMGHIFASIFTGLAGGTYGLLTYGSSLWHTLGYYVLGGWAGIAVMAIAYLILHSARPKSI
jgi:hypothetical protein